MVERDNARLKAPVERYQLFARVMQSKPEFRDQGELDKFKGILREARSEANAALEKVETDEAKRTLRDIVERYDRVL